jgi:endonuclease YncB( thermonuclease family)
MRQILYFLFVISFFIFSPFSAHAKDNIKVIDGDTIHIGKLKYRFSGIDAPEMKQLCNKDGKEVFCGVLAKNVLIEKINNSPVTCKIEEIDRYKRLVAECFVREESLSKFLVKNGYAVAYRRYSMKFVEDENYAKENKLGLWSMTFEYPWDYRANRK